MFHLKPADGAAGAHVSAVQNAYQNLQRLAEKKAGLTSTSHSRS
jgi:hypothetical protein